MRESDVIPYLLRHGLIERACIVNGDVRVIDASRRNCNFRVIREDGPSYLLKKGGGRTGFSSTAREALIYEIMWVTAEPRGAARFLPKVHVFDRDEGILILELFPKAEDLRQYHRRTGRFPTRVSAQIGRALATLHGLAPAASERSSERELAAPEPAGLSFHRPGLSLLRDFSGACTELVRLIQSSAEVCESLDALRSEWRSDAFIHQDARWDNVLLVESVKGRAPAIKLIDWEAAGLGDAAWDLGAMFGDYLGFWVSSIPLAGNAPPHRYLGLAQYPLDSMQPALSACWRAYAAAAGLGASEAGEFLRRAARYAGLKLIHTSLEQVQGLAEPTATAICLLQVGVNMLKRPGDAVAMLFGISPN